MAHGKIEYAETWDYNEVWWDDSWELWGLTAYTADHDQVGDTEWFMRKADAIEDSGLYIELGRCKRTVVYTKAGKRIGR